MEKATQINISDSKVHQTSDFVLISRKKGFDSISLCDVGSGLDEERVDAIIEEIAETMENERYTIVEVPIRRIIVNSPKQ